MTFQMMMTILDKIPKLKFRSEDAAYIEQTYSSIDHWLFVDMLPSHVEQILTATDWEIEE